MIGISETKGATTGREAIQRDIKTQVENLQAEQPREIPLVLERLDEVIATLSRNIDRLNARLKPTIISTPEMADEELIPHACSDLAAWLTHACNRIDLITRDVIRMESNCQL